MRFPTPILSPCGASFSPYGLNSMLVSTATMQDILSLSEMKDAQAGLNFHGSGKMITPLGAALLPTTAMADQKSSG